MGGFCYDGMSVVVVEVEVDARGREGGTTRWRWIDCAHSCVLCARSGGITMILLRRRERWMWWSLYLVHAYCDSVGTADVTWSSRRVRAPGGVATKGSEGRRR
jgi:hypothetical protein